MHIFVELGYFCSLINNNIVTVSKTALLRKIPISAAPSPCHLPCYLCRYCASFLRKRPFSWPPPRTRSRTPRHSAPSSSSASSSCLWTATCCAPGRTGHARWRRTPYFPPCRPSCWWTGTGWTSCVPARKRRTSIVGGGTELSLQIRLAVREQREFAVNAISVVDVLRGFFGWPVAAGLQ